MKTKYVFEIMELDDSCVAVPIGINSTQFNGVLKVNETGAAILKLLEKDTTEDKIIDELLKEYEGDREQVLRFVHDYLQKLIAEGLIEN